MSATPPLWPDLVGMIQVVELERALRWHWLGFRHLDAGSQASGQAAEDQPWPVKIARSSAVTKAISI